MIVEVALALLWARLLCLLPMRTWVRLAGLRIAAAAPPIDAADAELGALVRCLRGVARRAPWRANCLPQAIAAMQLLRRRGYRPVMYLGARRLQPGNSATMLAHAWVMCAGRMVCGGGAEKHYHSVAALCGADDA